MSDDCERDALVVSPLAVEFVSVEVSFCSGVYTRRVMSSKGNIGGERMIGDGVSDNSEVVGDGDDGDDGGYRSSSG